MDKKLVIASSNQGKIKEFKEILEPFGYEVIGLEDLDVHIEIEETGTTFAENAIIKAQTVTDTLHIPAIADDSGIEIDAMNKEPGIHSARWMGYDTSYDIKNQAIIDFLEDKKDRTCRYVCAIALTRPDEEPIVFEDTVEGTVAFEPKGKNGFGYDPIVFYPPYNKTMAEMDADEKNEISHRGKATKKLERWLREEG